MELTANKLNWYAVYTAPRAEKKLSERFLEKGIEHYLPLQKVKRCWSDRIKEIELPVISGYIFVRISDSELTKVTSTYGAIAIVREGGSPVVIHDCQLAQLKFMVEYADQMVEYCFQPFEQGETITIVKGPLEGMMGELLEVKGKYKVLIRLERFGSAVTTVPLSFIERLEVCEVR